MPQALLIVKTLCAILALVPELLDTMDKLFPPGSPQGADIGHAPRPGDTAGAGHQVRVRAEPDSVE